MTHPGEPKIMRSAIEPALVQVALGPGVAPCSTRSLRQNNRVSLKRAGLLCMVLVRVEWPNDLPLNRANVNEVR